MTTINLFESNKGNGQVYKSSYEIVNEDRRNFIAKLHTNFDVYAMDSEQNNGKDIVNVRAYILN